MTYVSKFILCLFLVASNVIYAQENSNPVMEENKLPYYNIPDYPTDYTATGVAARMIDGLGFRYYWATEGLQEDDLSYRPDSTARTSKETLEHIFALSQSISNATRKLPNIRPVAESFYSWAEQRRMTLENLKIASDILRQSPPEKLKEYKVVFQRGDKVSEYPFWNLINGQIADALWHCGQIVSFRRASGNPIDGRVNVFRGIIKE